MICDLARSFDRVRSEILPASFRRSAVKIGGQLKDGTSLLGSFVYSSDSDYCTCSNQDGSDLLWMPHCSIEACEHRGGQNMMTTTYPNPEETHFSTDPKRTAIRTGDFKTDEGVAREDDEDEMMTALWAADTGNQGA